MENGLPAPLGPRDVEAYRRAFAATERGDHAAADRALALVDDRRLVGTVLADRHLAAQSRAGFAELQAWLQAYADHADAPAIHALAVKRAAKGQAATLRRPTVGEGWGARWQVDDLGPAVTPAMPAGRKFSPAERNHATRIKADLRRQLRAGDLDRGEAMLARPEAARLLSEGEVDAIRAQIAAGWFARGETRRAHTLAAAAAKRSGRVVARANWIAGLADYADGRYDQASQHFAALAEMPRASPWDIAAGAFWASRAELHARRFDRVNRWLAVAADHPRTFYGLLANAALGQRLPFVWEPPSVNLGDLQALVRSGPGARALMLVQLGRASRAEAELARVAANAGPELLRPLLTIASRAGMPSLATRLARELSELDGLRYEGVAYPVPPWRPSGGFEVDRALVYAFMRQESQFNPRAVSPAGARGLMQIMPGTAKIVHGAPVPRDKLLDPVFNVTLGQRYLARLLATESVQGDLIKLAASYNAGPGNVTKWQQRHGDKVDPQAGDALLAIETLPSPETRHFITRLLYSYWMYSERLGQPTPTLDAVARGLWPTYVAQDGRSTTIRNAQTR